VFIWGIIPVLIKYLPGMSNSDSLSRAYGFVIGDLLFFIGIYLVMRIVSKDLVAFNGKLNKYFYAMLFSAVAWIVATHFSLSSASSTNYALITNFAPVVALMIGVIFWRSSMPYMNSTKSMVTMFLIFTIG